MLSSGLELGREACSDWGVGTRRFVGDRRVLEPEAPVSGFFVSTTSGGFPLDGEGECASDSAEDSIIVSVSDGVGRMPGS